MNLVTQRNTLRVVKIALLTIQAAIIVILIRFAFGDFVSTLHSPEEFVSFDQWYGNWPVVLTTSVFFLLFLFFLTRPRRPKEWKGRRPYGCFLYQSFHRNVWHPSHDLSPGAGSGS